MRIRKIPTPIENFDEPWKQIVRGLFPQFLEFFSPEMAADIDWSREVQFLDKELRRIAKGLVRRRRVTADVLAKVWRRAGSEQWLIIHIELQAQRDPLFAERMFLYNVRAYDLYRMPVESLAVLADSEVSWRPDRFGYGSNRTKVEIAYPLVKLVDWRARQSELEVSENPFALAVRSHLKTQETRGECAGAALVESGSDADAFRPALDTRRDRRALSVYRLDHGAARSARRQLRDAVCSAGKGDDDGGDDVADAAASVRTWRSFGRGARRSTWRSGWESAW